MANITKKAEQGEYSAESIWLGIVKSKLKDTKKITDIGEYTVYLNDDIYFLTNSDLKYLGFIEVRKTDDPKVFRIAYTNSALSGGFYKLMFQVMFDSGIKELYSDVSISSNAFKSYQNMFKKNYFNVQVITDEGEYLKFSRKNLTDKELNRVSIKQK